MVGAKISVELRPGGCVICRGLHGMPFVFDCPLQLRPRATCVGASVSIAFAKLPAIEMDASSCQSPLVATGELVLCFPHPPEDPE